MPILMVIAGPNGSGKSTLTAKLVKKGLQFGQYLNADDIATKLSGPPEWVSRKAQQLVRDKREAALNEQRDHAFETVMSHPSHIEYMTRAVGCGFEVRLLFVATEHPEINLERVANRVIHGGHPVPPDRIIARYQRCLDNLQEAMRAAHECVIYDNSSAERPLGPLAIVSRDRGGRHLAHFDPDQSDEDYIGTTPAHDIPAWWLEVLLEIKPINPFLSGPLA